MNQPLTTHNNMATKTTTTIHAYSQARMRQKKRGRESESDLGYKRSNVYNPESIAHRLDSIYYQFFRKHLDGIPEDLQSEGVPTPPPTDEDLEKMFSDFGFKNGASLSFAENKIIELHTASDNFQGFVNAIFNQHRQAEYTDYFFEAIPVIQAFTRQFIEDMSNDRVAADSVRTNSLKFKWLMQKMWYHAKQIFDIYIDEMLYKRLGNTLYYYKHTEGRPISEKDKAILEFTIGFWFGYRRRVYEDSEWVFTKQDSCLVMHGNELNEIFGEGSEIGELVDLAKKALTGKRERSELRKKHCVVVTFGKFWKRISAADPDAMMEEEEVEED